MTLDLRDPALKLVSFDVFDTVVLRRCGAPESVFHIVGKKLRGRGLLDLGSAAFAQTRAEAERRSRQHREGGEITLEMIYAELNRLWLLPDPLLAEVIACELETERENLVAVPGIRRLLDQVRRAGKRITFVSDMYLPEEFIKSVLGGLGLIASDDRLYVSSRWNATKAEGGLFRIALEREGLSGADVLHLGDHRHSDVRSPRRMGIRACKLDRGVLNRFEVLLGSAGATPENAAGLSRLARLAADKDGESSVPAALGASLAGPLLTAYAEWVLRSALNRNLRRLYFLARDGQAILRVCELLAPALGASGIELKYLHGSRQVWSPAALVKMDAEAADFFAGPVAFNGSTWEQCVGYLGFEAADFAQTALPAKWASLQGSGGWKRQIFLDVVADPSLVTALRKRLESATGLVTRHLYEQGLMDGVACGLVDCGWSGTWTDLLGDLIVGQGGIAPVVFFIGRRKRAAPSRHETLAWMFDHHMGGGLKDIPDFFHVVVEFLLTADHGRTVGYEEVDGRLKPRLAEVDWQGFTPESWRVYRDALEGFVMACAARAGTNNVPGDARAALTGMVAVFWENPTMEEAHFFSAHAIGLSPSRANIEPIARPYRWADVLTLALLWRLPGFPPFWWHEGSLALSQSSRRMPMALMWETRELLRALRDRRRGKVATVPQLLLRSVRKLKMALASPERLEGPSFDGGASVGRQVVIEQQPSPKTSATTA